MVQSTNTIKETELSEETVRLLSKAKNEPEWMLKQRLAAFKAFEELPMPQLSYGLHINAPANIALNELRPLENVTTNKGSNVNGVVIEDLSVAAAKYEEALRPMVAGSDFRHKLDALHSAFWNSGIFVYAPKRKSRETATHVSLQHDLFGTQIDTSLLGPVANPASAGLRSRPLLTCVATTWEKVNQKTGIVAIVVVAEENANLLVTELITEAAATGGKAYCFEGASIRAAPNSTVKFATLQKLGSNTNSTIVQKALAEKDATVDWVNISVGGGSTRQETVTALNGEGANSTITGAFFGDGSQQLDIMAKELHNARNTKSNIRIKGALQGRARAIVQSFTKIMKTAANSEGHQKANVLLLSDTARASPIPKLEIDNYDVKASHEASVGQLDSEKLFYLMSRGLDSREATTLAVEGFFEPLLRGLPVAELADEMRETIRNKLKAAEEELAR